MEKTTIKKVEESKTVTGRNSIAITFKSAQGKVDTITLNGVGKLKYLAASLV